jgi:DNA-binding response OmpR family regulator
MSSIPPPIPGKKILIVDDDAVVVRALTMKLQGKGFQVLTAMDGSEAVKIVRKESPDLVVLDVNFPSDVTGVPWDGFRIVEWVRRLDASRPMPVIIITGGDPEKLKGRVAEIGAVAFFQKPVNNDELLKVIRKTLDEQPVTAAKAPDTGAHI